MSDLVTFLSIYFLIVFFIFAVCYVIQGIALMRVAKLEGYKTWMAWVPIADSYLEIKVAGGNPWFLFLYAVGLVIYFIGGFTGITLLVIAGTIANMVFAVYNIVITYRILRKYNVGKVFFWVGLFIFPVLLVGYYKMGVTAKNMLAEKEY